METTTDFTYLRTKLEEWKANDLLLPPHQVSWERFKELARAQLVQVLHEAQAVLESQGLEVSLTDLDEETRALGLYVRDCALFFTPGDDPLMLELTGRRLTATEPEYTDRLLYRSASPERLRKWVEEYLLRLLGPRRDTTRRP